MNWMNFSESMIRWMHVLAAILWVGHLWFFNFVNAQFVPTMDAETKRKVLPELMPRGLFWFRWAGLITWVTGVLLLGLVFYMGGETLEGGKGTPWVPLGRVMLLVTFLAPFLYEVAIKTVLRKGPALFFGGFALVCAALWGFKASGFSHRGLLIHTGALFGTIMAFNVWFRIWPAQKRILKAIKAGETPDAEDAALAAARSKHNTFLSVPIVFLMLNAHNYWASSYSDAFPILTAAVVLFGWGLAQHLYGISRRVKGL